MKQIEIKTSKKLKWTSDEEAEKFQEYQKNLARKQATKQEITNADFYDPKEIFLNTLHLIDFVMKREDKGPHGEPTKRPIAEQRMYFKVMNRIEELPEGATHIELQNSEVEFIAKKIKAYKDRWFAFDPIFDAFEVSFGTSDEAGEETPDPSHNGVHKTELAK